MKKTVGFVIALYALLDKIPSPDGTEEAVESMAEELAFLYKGLTLLETISLEYGGTDREMNPEMVYKVSHVLLGNCENPHNDWREEIEQLYKVAVGEIDE